MYSIVLAAMMTAAPASPAWGWHKGCHGCCSGCYGCCWGGSCYGCWGGCYGCAGCYGCTGWTGYYAPLGCYSCVGTGCNTACWGCKGCGFYAPYSSFGCGGCWGCWGGAVIINNAAGLNLEKKAAVSADQAEVVVQLPADAKLYVDGQLSKLTGASRALITPELQTGREYTYTLKVETTRDGQTVTDTKDVAFKGGDSKKVSFTDVAEKTSARVSVTLPKDAKLYVDGVLCPQKTGTPREFETPELAAGQKYYYTMTTELDLGGQTKTDTRQVVVEAGKRIVVDFSAPNSATATARK